MSFKETWQNILTKIDNRIPIKKITGPLDKKFPLTSFFLFLLIILVVLYFILGSSLASRADMVDITIRLADSENNVLDNFDFKIRNLSEGTLNSYRTNQNGSLTLSLDRKKLYLLIIDSVGYEYTEKEITFSSPSLNFIIPILNIQKDFLKTVYFEDALTNLKIKEELNITIVCDNQEIITPSSASTTDGTLAIRVPSNCQKLSATIVGDRYNERSISIPATQSTFSINPFVEVRDTGSISVSVLSGDLFIEESITLKLFSINDPVTAIKTVQTNFGVGFFNSVEAGEYIVKASDIQNRYLQNQTQVIVIKNKKAEAMIIMADTSTGTIINPDTNQEINIKQITVFIKDKATGEVLDETFSPKVTLLLDGNQNIEERNLHEGFIFNIDTSKDYSLKAEAEGYITGNILPVLETQSTYIFNLEKITISNVSKIVVKIQDEDLKPMMNIKTWIYDSQGQYIDPRFSFSISDENGISTFENIPDLNFTIKVKNDFLEEISSVYHNAPPEDTNITLPIVIGKGTIKLNVKNKLGDSISDAQATFYYESLEVLGTSLVSANGFLENQVKADKRVFVKIESSGYLPYFTELFRIYKNKTVTKEIILERALVGDEVSVEYFGLFNTSENKVESLKNNEVFYLKYKVIMPSSSSSFNFAFRAGSKVDVSEDIVFIMPQSSSLGVSTYYEKEPFSVSGNFLESKLVNVQVVGYPASVHEITIPIRIKNAKTNDKVSLFYTSSINSINFMNTQYSQLQYFVDATSLCNNTFCFSGQYVDVLEGLRYDIGSNRLVPMQVNSDYILEYTISNSSSNNFSQARVSARNLKSDNTPATMINIKKYSLSGEFVSSGNIALGETNFNIPFNAPELLKDNFSAFSNIDYSLEVIPLNLGQSKLVNRVISAQQEVYSLPINFVVSELEKMSVSYEPQNIVPGTPFTLTVTVKDSKGNFLEGVNINILQKVNNDTLTVSTGKTTNEKGVVNISLPSLRTGETFIIEAIKSKYYATPLEFSITKNILDVKSKGSLLTSTSPLQASIHKTNLNGELYTLVLENKTAYDISLKQFNTHDVSFNKSDLLNLEQTVNYLNNQITSSQEGFIIPANSSKELVIKFAPSQSARSHPVSVDILGVVTGKYLLNNNEYLFDIPVNVKLSVGSGILEDNCVIVTQGVSDWTTVIAGSPQTTTLTITNTCLSKEGKTPIAVKNVQAKITSQGDRFGVYFFKLIGPASASQIQLSENYYRIVIPEMRPEEIYKIDLTFNPNGTKFAEVKTNIHLNAQVETEQGLVFVNNGAKEVILKANLSLMDLTECFGYVDNTGKTINSGGLYVLNGIEENNLTINNKCVGKATFRMDLCDAFDDGCRDLKILNTDEERNILNFSLLDAQKTVTIKRDSTKAPGAYILNNRVSVVNNFQRELAFSFVLLKINAKDQNGLWMEDPFIEINENKTSEVTRLYNNNLEKTLWHFLNQSQSDFTITNFNKDYNPYQRNINFIPFDELSSSKGTDPLLWATSGVSIGIIASSILAEIGIVGALLVVPVWGWIGGGALLAIAALAPTFTNIYDVEQDFLTTDFNLSYFSTEYKEITLNNLSSENLSLSVVDLTGLKNINYYKSELNVKGKLIKKKTFTNIINKCPSNQEFVSITNNFDKYDGCSMYYVFVEEEGTYKFNISCQGGYPRNEVNLKHNAYLVCKNNKEVWPEQAGIKALKYTLDDALYSQVHNDSRKYFFKENTIVPTLNENSSSDNHIFSDDFGKYRVGFFLTKPEETPNYDLNLQDCVTDTGRSGKTGEGAVPNISLDWKWNLQDTTKCSETYCDATQLSQVVLNRINEAEKLISLKTVQCPISYSQIDNKNKNGGYVVSAEPSRLDNEIPVNRSGINSVRINTENNSLIIKVTLENRNSVVDNGTLSLKLSNYTPKKIEIFDESLGSFKAVSEIKETIPIIIVDNDITAILYHFENNPVIIADNLSLNIVYNSSNNFIQHSVFNSLLSLSVYEYTNTSECLVPATTARYDGTSYLDMWLNKQMYPDNVVGSGWPEEDIIKLKNILEFDAYLITDKYNESFIKDFDIAYGGLASKKDGTGTGNYAIMASPTVYSNDYLSLLFKNNLKFVKEYSNEVNNVNINVPGKYKVRIDFLFDNASWKFKEGNDVDVNAFVTLRFISSPETDSIFYRMPFNGFVGKTNSGYNRQGYGVSYTGDSIRIDNDYTVTDSDYGSNALKNINITKSNDLSKINSNIETRGNLLSLKYDQYNNIDLLLTPSSPIPLLMSIDKGNNTPLNVYYRLKDSSDNAISLTSLLRWTGVGSGCDFSGNSIYNMSYNDRYAGAEGATFAFLIDWPQINRTGKIYLRTIFYAPEKQTYSLENRTSQGVNVRFSTNGTSYSSSVSLGEGNLAVSSIADVFNMIRENKVCVVNSSDGSSSEFFYNQTEIFSQKFIDSPQDSLKCS